MSANRKVRISAPETTAAAAPDLVSSATICRFYDRIRARAELAAWGRPVSLATMVREASLEPVASGLAPVTDGWFVVNVKDAAWEQNAFGDACFFENPEAPFDELGVCLRVLWPGRSTWLYHAESAQEAFLVLAGEALLLVEDQERPLAAWDFVHCPPGTRHAFLATGTEPCVIVMVGARPTPHT